ncbi:hypothetical protein J3R83DRAFT_6318 [Lanmaoa asiatica]|nr:hypothetical protein J3R83DRAFT_6318 [Lanmaoa asiatica]
MSSTDNEDDLSFVALSARLRHRIDNAFDSIVSSGTQLRQSRFDVPPGGFIAEESESGPSQPAEYEAGGFIIEDIPSNSSGTQSYIPLSEIPRALNLLDLFSDDDIMGVFKNAATGWGAQNARNDGVNRKDWRAVCAALLEGEYVEGSDRENPVADEDIEMGADSEPDSDEYHTEDLSGDTEEALSDEYEEPSRAASARAGKAQKVPRRTPTKSSGTSEISSKLTKSQKAQCRQDFSRFFPHVPDNELDHQRIMIKDITRVADLLKENLKAEEVGAPQLTLAFLTHVPKILEMLEAFSTSPDKSMNLADFEHMMILTNLV